MELADDGTMKKPSKKAKCKMVELQIASQNESIRDSWVEAIQAVITAANEKAKASA
jgi:hypothetical protein